MIDYEKVREVLDGLFNSPTREPRVYTSVIADAFVTAGLIPDDDLKEERTNALINRYNNRIDAEAHAREEAEERNIYAFAYGRTRRATERGWDINAVKASLLEDAHPEWQRIASQAIEDALAGHPPRHPIPKDDS
jgi:hypothetical protein